MCVPSREQVDPTLSTFSFLPGTGVVINNVLRLISSLCLSQHPVVMVK